MSALNYNKIIIAGHLTADPELRRTQAGKAVTTYTVSVNRREGEADFFTVVAWEAQAEFVCKYFRKGSAIMVEGEMHLRKYEDKDGNKRTAAEITSRNACFVDSKASTPPEQQSAEKPPKNEPQDVERVGFSNTLPTTDFADVAGDDDLPF